MATRKRKRGIEVKYSRLYPRQQEHLEQVARYLSVKRNENIDWCDVVMQTLHERWPIGVDPAEADKAHNAKRKFGVR